MHLCDVRKNDQEIIKYYVTEVAGVKYLDARTFLDNNGQLIPLNKNATVVVSQLPGIINEFKAQVKEMQETVNSLEKAFKILQDKVSSDLHNGRLLKEFTRSINLGGGIT